MSDDDLALALVASGKAADRQTVSVRGGDGCVELDSSSESEEIKHIQYVTYMCPCGCDKYMCPCVTYMCP